jgi:hypothetical protein
MAWCIGKLVSGGLFADERAGFMLPQRNTVSRARAGSADVCPFDGGHGVFEGTPLGQRIGASPPGHLGAVDHEHDTDIRVVSVKPVREARHAGRRAGSVDHDDVCVVEVDQCSQVSKPLGRLDAETASAEEKTHCSQVATIARGQQNRNWAQLMQRSHRNLQERQRSSAEHKTPAIAEALDLRTEGADLWLGTTDNRIDRKEVVRA